jgi:hypothetical protein
MSGSYLRVRNWNSYQQYQSGKNIGNRQWIKLHVSMLHDIEVMTLPIIDRWLVCMSLLLAAQTNNHIPNDKEWLQIELKMDKPPDLKLLLSTRFLETCECGACVSKSPRTLFLLEKERKKDKKKESPPKPAGKKRKIRKKVVYLPGFQQWWDKYPGMRKYAKEQCHGKWVARELEEELSGQLKALQLFIDYHPDWQEAKTICAPLVYLNQRRWEDAPKPGGNGEPLTCGKCGNRAPFMEGCEPDESGLCGKCRGRQKQHGHQGNEQSLFDHPS